MKIVNRYIGVTGGYLGDFSYRTDADFYPEHCCGGHIKALWVCWLVLVCPVVSVGGGGEPGEGLVWPVVVVFGAEPDGRGGIGYVLVTPCQ